jgi:acetyl esterase/lipase
LGAAFVIWHAYERAFLSCKRFFASARVDPRTAGGASSRVIPLWPDGAPGSEARRGEPELAKDWWVRNVHDPSLTAFFPRKGDGCGTAVIIAPGGGHREIVFDAEGVAPAQYLARLGVTAFALKYRLSQDAGSTYDLETHSAADIRRAVRLVRSLPKEWGLHPDRVGVMGWSAGAELAAMVSYRPVPGDPSSADPVERVSAKPAFQILIYPGGYGIPDQVPADAPAAFFLSANDDEGPATNVVRLVQKYRDAGVSAEAHLYAEGRHAFNMGRRSTFVSLRAWPERMADWLVDRGLIPERRPGR